MSRHQFARCWQSVVSVVVLLPLLAACGFGSSDASQDTSAWVTDDEATSSATGTESSSPEQVNLDAHIAIATEPAYPPLTAIELQSLQPNELGAIPVLEYHEITTDPAEEADVYSRTADHLRGDLQWLYDHNFYVISARQLVENRIAAPKGKRPVVLTFDDSRASQFLWHEVSDGVRVIDPDTAMGVLEAFFQAHPDFGRGGLFAVLPFNCFADGSPLNTPEDCPDKLRWMADNGYEIANHTASHQDLLDVSDEEFAFELGDPFIWVRQFVQGDANAMDLLVLPFGNYPSRELHPEQREMMRNGFTYQGVEIQVRGAFMVGANPTESPSSTQYDPLFIARIQAYGASLDQWFGWFEDGQSIVYVSDGNPTTVTIPDPVPNALADQFDPQYITADGQTLIQYDPVTGLTTGTVSN